MLRWEPGSIVDNYIFSPDERPTSAGAPYLPRLSLSQRLAYAAVGVFIGALTTFPNALTNVNVGTISGSLHLYVSEASWLPALYFGMNASANLTLVKARAQFGIPLVTRSLLILYVMAAAVQLAWPCFGTAVGARITNGIETGALVSLTVYYFLMVFPGKFKPLALIVGVSMTQFGTPLARLVPVELLGVDHWRGMHCIELAVPLLVLAVTWAVPLPPSDRSRAFEFRDVISIALFVPGIVLGCEVLNLGRVLWWSDTPMLGKILMACVVLIGAGCIVEVNRERPLVQLAWLSTANIARFVGIALLMRLALAEQTFGSVGLLSASGLNNDQMHVLFGLVALSMVAGVVAAALTLREDRLPYQIIVAALCIMCSALLDSESNNLTRPAQLYLSQSLIGFGTTLFIGPAIVYGMLQMLRKGMDHFITIVVVFSITQNVGALAGASLMGTYQIERVQVHSADLASQMVASDPQVAARIGGGAIAVSPAVQDPGLQAAEGSSLLGQSMSREAAVLAFNDVFGLLAWLAGATAGLVALSVLYNKWRQAPLRLEAPT
jgi:hypothetical protein